MKKDLTASVYSFEDMIQGNFLYIDKTEYLWKLLQPAKGMYFLSRPRRFGKSLTLSTLKAIFQGKKELFRGLAIYDKPYDWKHYPVIHLDMNGREFDTVDALKSSLSNMVAEQARALNIPLEMDSPATMLQKLIEKSSAVSSVILLLDEYDKPILNNITEPNVNNFLKVLKAFYSVIKEKADKIRFAFVTGVTKFCHVSIFSDMNNLLDITMDADYATMLGYTQAEVERNFTEWIAETEARQELPHTEYLAEIKKWYDGYRFEETAETVYNPVSLAIFFIKHGKFQNYWFATGTPTSLFEVMKKKNFNFPKEFNAALSDELFNAFELDHIDPLVLLYQTGYVTIAECRRRQVPYTHRTVTEYFVRFPNFEVEESFNNYLLQSYAGVPEKDSQHLILAMVEAVGDGDVEKFIGLLKGIFAAIPYSIHLKHEHYYQTIIYVIYDLLRLYIQAEHQTNDGRADLVLTAGEWIYVVELKMNKTAAEAMQQLENKDYAMQFQNRGKRIMAIGINFDVKHGQIADWQKEELTAE